MAELNTAFPARFDVNFFLGLALESQDRAGEALEHFRQALELNPPAVELPSIYVHLGTCQKDLGYFKEAAESFTRALELDPNLKEAHHFLGFCCFKLEDYQQAVACFEKVIELNRARPSTTLTWGSICSGWGTARRRRLCSNRPWNWTRPWTSLPGPWLYWRNS